MFCEAILSVTETLISFQDKYCQKTYLPSLSSDDKHLCLVLLFVHTHTHKAQTEKSCSISKVPNKSRKTNRRQFLAAASYTDKALCVFLVSCQPKPTKKNVSFILMQFYPCTKFIIISTQLFPL